MSEKTKLGANKPKLFNSVCMSIQQKFFSTASLFMELLFESKKRFMKLDIQFVETS